MDSYGSSGQAILHAYDANNIATELYNSNQNESRDQPGPAVKFTIPTIVNGKVYVPTATQLSVFGCWGIARKSTHEPFCDLVQTNQRRAVGCNQQE